MNYIYLSLIVPAFLGLFAFEYMMARDKRSRIFSYESTVTNLSVGIAERLLSLFVVGGFYVVFDWIYTHFALLEIPNRWWVWGVLLLATDLVWYWYHRFGHEINLFWGAHIVHHQSEEYNFTVAARITIIQALVRNVFWSLLPLVGFHPAMVTTILMVHSAYSFFTHTELVGKLGWLEHIFITPSHHRVHHASNEQYLNKNYGDIFVFWDKLFGTFELEREKPSYGLTHPLKSHSFLWAHFHYYAEMYEACRRSGSLWQSLKIIFGRPEDLDQDIRPYLEAKLLPARVPYRGRPVFEGYLNVQIGLSLAALFLFTLFFGRTDWVDQVFFSGLILFTLINCGALLDQKRWIYYLEIIRLVWALTYFSYQLESISLWAAGICLLVVIAMLKSVERLYFKALYDYR